MFKIILKHCIYEKCIDIFFNNLYKNFTGTMPKPTAEKTMPKPTAEKYMKDQAKLLSRRVDYNTGTGEFLINKKFPIFYHQHLLNIKEKREKKTKLFSPFLEII